VYCILYIAASGELNIAALQSASVLQVAFAAELKKFQNVTEESSKDGKVIHCIVYCYVYRYIGM